MRKSATIDLVVIGVFLLLLIVVGVVLSRRNRNDGDYFKSGSRGTWWLVGASNFMAGFSAWTFTGGAGVAFEAGWSVLLMGLGGLPGAFFISALFLAGWFRQLRATTMPEVICSRFGPGTQQFYAWINVVTRLLYSSLHLYGFAIFASTVFGWNVFIVIAAIGLTVLLYATFGGNVAAAPQFFACKDGREARRAAFLVGCLVFVSIIVFYLPPIVARLVAAPEVLASHFDKPAESAYAVMSMKLLPPGLTGVMVVAILAATMSSMDIGLNRNAAIVTEDIYPTVCRLLKRAPLQRRGRLVMGRLVSACLGLAIIGLALNFAAAGGKQGIFGIMLNVNATLTVPLAIPLVLCLFIRDVPRWTAIISAAVTLVPSLTGFFSKTLFGQEWSFQQKFFITAPIGVASFLVCRLFWSRETAAYRQRVAEFFTRMHTPVDFAREVGRATDYSQLRTVGVFSLIVASFIALLVFLPHDREGRLQVLAVAGAIGSMGACMVAAPGIQRRVAGRQCKWLPLGDSSPSWPLLWSARQG